MFFIIYIYVYWVGLAMIVGGAEISDFGFLE